MIVPEGFGRKGFGEMSDAKQVHSNLSKVTPQLPNLV